MTTEGSGSYKYDAKSPGQYNQYAGGPSTRSGAIENFPTTSSTVTYTRNSSSPTATSSISTNASRAAPPISPSPQAASKESFFISIHQRLLQLESNSKLSLRYIEEQSRILRDAFNKVERRQISTATAFLSSLNETVRTEFHGFRQAYDQLWQSTVIELGGQREQYQREMLALSQRLTLVADELVWQKCRGIAHSTLLLMCLGMVLPQAAVRAGWESEPNYPSSASRSPVSLFRRKTGRSSAEAFNGTLTDESESRPETRDGGPEVEIEPSTPPEVVDASESEASDQSGPGTQYGTATGLGRAAKTPFGGIPSSPLRFESQAQALSC